VPFAAVAEEDPQVEIPGVSPTAMPFLKQLKKKELGKNEKQWTFLQ